MEPATLAVNVTQDVTAVVYGTQVFRLRFPIRIHAHRDGNLFIHEYEPLGISAYGFTQAESLQAFAEEFSSCWHWIGLEEDRRLGPDARELKRKLLRLVETVQPVHEFLPHQADQRRAVR